MVFGIKVHTTILVDKRMASLTLELPLDHHVLKLSMIWYMAVKDYHWLN